MNLTQSGLTQRSVTSSALQHLLGPFCSSSVVLSREEFSDLKKDIVGVFSKRIDSPMRRGSSRSAERG